MDLKETLRQTFHQCRLGTLAQFAEIDDAAFCAQPHPDFSPPGWHLGHIAYTEALWLLQHLGGMPPLFPQYHRLFAADGLPKSDRTKLPSRLEILEYLQLVRDKVFAYLEVAPLEEQLRLWYFILQHECQHGETIAFVTHLAGQGTVQSDGEMKRETREDRDWQSAMLTIRAGAFDCGNDGAEALDNERARHRCYLETYEIDRYPVTCGEYRQFIAAGGYRDRDYWSEAGWEWLQANPVDAPLYLSDDPAFETHPVCGVSWYEAEAYANFAGKRLPSEAEWEKAASWNPKLDRSQRYPWGNEPPTGDYCNCDRIVSVRANGLHVGTTPVDAYPQGESACGCRDLLGNVWEWTASYFQGYEGFECFPYQGYSQAYFDGKHRVLKGGSWVTRPQAMRSSFRNWYHPHIRQIYAGFRCAR
jgi:gamma-glutamyl hercynylcysteine S-oxide synthase